MGGPGGLVPVPAAVAPPSTNSVGGLKPVEEQVDKAISEEDAGGSGLPFWATVLIGLLVLLCIGVSLGFRRYCRW